MARDRIGFIGLGDMAFSMARRLLKDGLTVFGCANRRREPIEALKKEGLIEEKDPRSVGAQSDILMTIVVGLIQSWRNDGNHRRYARDVLRKLAVIKVAQRAGVPLKEIGDAMATIPQEGKVTARDWSRLAKIWRNDLDDRINRLTRLRDTLGYCIGCGCLSVKDCKLMNPNDELGKKGPGPRLLDPD